MLDRLLYSLKEAADALGPMDVKTLIRNHIATGQLPYLIVGKRTKKITPELVPANLRSILGSQCLKLRLVENRIVIRVGHHDYGDGA